MKWTAEPLALLALAFSAVVWLGYVWGSVLLCRFWCSRRTAPQPPSASLPHFTVLVCYHNEATVLPQLLESLSRLQYPHWAVVLVNDRSTDGSAQLVARWQSRLSAPVTCIDIATTPAGWTPRKWALLQGLQAAPAGWVALTDADCTVPPHWLHAFAAQANDHTDILLGHGAYAPSPGLLGWVVQAETLLTAARYHALAAHGWPYMAVGRSMALHTGRVEAAAVLAPHRHIPSGSDDLLVQAHPHPQRVQPCPTACTTSVGPATWADWLARKRRHMGAGQHYRGRYVALLLLWQLVPLAVVASCWAIPGAGWGRAVVVVCWLVPWLLHTWALAGAAHRLAALLPRWQLGLLEIFQYFYTAFLSLSSLAKLPATWQKRTPPLAKQKTKPS